MLSSSESSYRTRWVRQCRWAVVSGLPSRTAKYALLMASGHAHIMVAEPVQSNRTLDRWSCVRCGRSVIRDSAGRTYGDALGNHCTEEYLIPDYLLVGGTSVAAFRAAAQSNFSLRDWAWVATFSTAGLLPPHPKAIRSQTRAAESIPMGTLNGNTVHAAQKSCCQPKTETGSPSSTQWSTCSRAAKRDELEQ